MPAIAGPLISIFLLPRPRTPFNSTSGAALSLRTHPTPNYSRENQTTFTYSVPCEAVHINSVRSCVVPMYNDELYIVVLGSAEWIY